MGNPPTRIWLMEEIPNNHLGCIEPDGKNYQPQLVIAGFLKHQQYHIKWCVIDYSKIRRFCCRFLLGFCPKSLQLIVVKNCQLGADHCNYRCDSQGERDNGRQGCSMVFSDPQGGARLNPRIVKITREYWIFVIKQNSSSVATHSRYFMHPSVQPSTFAWFTSSLLGGESSHIPDFSPFKFESSQFICVWEIASVFSHLAYIYIYLFIYIYTYTVYIYIYIYICEMMHPKKILPQVIAPLPSLLFPFFRFVSIHLFTIKVGSVSSVESTFTPTSPLHGKPWSPFEKMEHGGDEMGKVCKSFLVNQPPVTYPARNKGFKKARKRTVI